ncbi:MAG: hypothetical protein RMN25_11740 [Anaerolineae bacterium]|nr:hypothetical protein [Thermoflexales bacterium]MDW8408441.1 hypothetical protein [Anaerolineae bacterium]
MPDRLRYRLIAARRVSALIHAQQDYSTCTYLSLPAPIHPAQLT